MNWIEIIANGLIPLILMVVTYKILPMVKEWRYYNIAQTAVLYAEQIWKSGTIQSNERYKKAYDYMKTKLDLSDEEIKILIEAAVKKI